MARYLALDWDQNQLHVIAANERGKTVQVQRASLWQEGQSPTLATAEDLGKALRDRLREAGIAPAPVIVCLGRDRVIVKDVRYPAVPVTEEPAVVRFQTVKELTDGGDDVIIDYLSAPGLAEGERKATALVIRRDILETYQKLCAAAGLKLAGIAPRMIGVSHCLRKVVGTTIVTPPPEPADGVVAVVVVGEKTAEFCVLLGSTFLLSRSIPAGTNLAGEIRRNLAVHAGQQPQHSVCAVYVAGKGSGELRERLGEAIEIPVHTFDPFAGSESLELPVGQRGSFAGAMGLLIARAQGELPINFVSPRQPKPPQNINYRMVRIGVAALIALVFGMVVLGRFAIARDTDKLESVKQTLDDVEKSLFNTQLNGKRLKGVDDWDTLVWIDELYDLTYRIPDSNALRVKSFTVDPIVRNAQAQNQSRSVAKVTIKGELLSRTNPRAPLNEMITRFTKDGYYSPEAPLVEGSQFTLVVSVERRAPTEYTYALKDVTPAEEEAATKALRSRGSKGKSKTFSKGMFSGKGKGGDSEAGSGEDEGAATKGRVKGKGRTRE